jgi:hypothetical protein
MKYDSKDEHRVPLAEADGCFWFALSILLVTLLVLAAGIGTGKIGFTTGILYG